MKEMRLTACNSPLMGEIHVPGDKSISHRAVIFGALAEGVTTVSHFLNGEDCQRTIEAFRLLGVKINQENTTLQIHSRGFSHLEEPREPIYFGNSGTTARLMLGILSAMPFFTVAYGDPSLTHRPMDRVVNPLKQMGAAFDGRDQGSYLPLAVRGGKLKGITYALPVKSAQVKSALLLAGLYAEGTTTIIEKASSRDHTEKMLQAFGANLTTNGKEITVNKSSLTATDVYVPGDISSAAFFLVAAAIVPGSNVTLKNVGLNETRTGVIDVLIEMGASVTVSNKQMKSGEMLGDITIKHQPLKASIIEGNIIPRLIDEIPIIALLATQAEGKTVIRDAEELRYKETDRIKAVVEGLSELGADIEATDDGMIVHGRTPLAGGNVKAYNDHRIAMMHVIASLIAQDDVTIDDVGCIDISYPTFFDDLQTISN